MSDVFYVCDAGTLRVAGDQADGNGISTRVSPPDWPINPRYGGWGPAGLTGQSCRGIVKTVAQLTNGDIIHSSNVANNQTFIYQNQARRPITEEPTLWAIASRYNRKMYVVDPVVFDALPWGVPIPNAASQPDNFVATMDAILAGAPPSTNPPGTPAPPGGGSGSLLPPITTDPSQWMAWVTANPVPAVVFGFLALKLLGGGRRRR